jgi:hypothetical protein
MKIVSLCLDETENDGLINLPAFSHHMYRNIGYMLFYMGVKLGLSCYVKNTDRWSSGRAFSGKQLDLRERKKETEKVS